MRFIGLAAAAILMTAPASAQMEMDVDQVKNILNLTKKNWIAFRDWNGKQLVYFTHLEAWRCQLEDVRYSINNDDLDRIWLLDECDPKNPNAIKEDRLPYVELPPNSIEYVAMQVTFVDGSETDIVRFEP